MLSRCAAHTGLAPSGVAAHLTARSTVTVPAPAASAKAAKSGRSRPSFASLKPKSAPQGQVIPDVASELPDRGPPGQGRASGDRARTSALAWIAVVLGRVCR